jgi:solute carrier family 25 (adenine nucleotide translocator) protein 4/5/6/31
MYNFFLGWIVTTSAGFLTYPLGTIKGRMMMRSMQPVKYTGSIDCIRYVLTNEGIRGFYGGAGYTLLRSIASAMALSVYEII